VTPNDGPDAAPDQHDQPGPASDNGSERPGDVPQPGSVAAEAALLVDLLSRRGWSSTSGMPGGSGGSGGSGSSGGSRGSGSSTGPATGGRLDGSERECTCGGTTPAACRVCPVCQLIAFVQQVNPDTIEKVADFVGFAATALRDLATAQRERQTDPATGNDTDETVDRDDTDDPAPGGRA